MLKDVDFMYLKNVLILTELGISESMSVFRTIAYVMGLSENYL